MTDLLSPSTTAGAATALQVSSGQPDHVIASPAGKATTLRPVISGSFASRRPRGRLASLHDKWWFAVCTLLLLVASDYKFRVRDPNSTLESKIDPAVLLEIVLYLLVFVYLIGYRPQLRIARMPVQLVATYFYVAIMLLSLAHGNHLSVEMIRAFEMVVVLLLAVTLARRGSRTEVHYFLHGFLVLVAASVVFGKVVPMPRFALQEDRFTWLRIHPVTSAVYMAVAALIAVAYLFARKAERPGPRWHPAIYAITGLLAAGALYENKTRGALLGLIVGVLVFAWLAIAVRRRLELLAFIIIGVGAFVAAEGSAIVAYAARGESTEKLASLNSRTGLWDVAWQYIQKQPLYGYGLGASHSLFLSTTGLGGAHDALVNVATDLGFVGALIWIWLIVTTTWAALMARRAPVSFRAERALLIGLMALLIVNGVSNGGLGDEANISSTLLFVLAGWSCVMPRRRPLGSDPTVLIPPLPALQPLPTRRAPFVMRSAAPATAQPATAQPATAALQVHE